MACLSVQTVNMCSKYDNVMCSDSLSESEKKNCWNCGEPFHEARDCNQPRRKKRGKKKSRRLGVRERDINIKNSQRNNGRVPNKKNSRQNGGRVLKAASLAKASHGEPDTSSDTGSCDANSDAKNSQRAGRVLVGPPLDETGQGGPETPQVRPGGGVQVGGVASALHDDVSGATATENGPGQPSTPDGLASHSTQAAGADAPALRRVSGATATEKGQGQPSTHDGLANHDAQAGGMGPDQRGSPRAPARGEGGHQLAAGPSGGGADLDGRDMQAAGTAPALHSVSGEMPPGTERISGETPRGPGLRQPAAGPHGGRAALGSHGPCEQGTQTLLMADDGGCGNLPVNPTPDPHRTLEMAQRLGHATVSRLLARRMATSAGGRTEFAPLHDEPTGAGAESTHGAHGGDSGGGGADEMGAARHSLWGEDTDPQPVRLQVLAGQPTGGDEPRRLTLAAEAYKGPPTDEALWQRPGGVDPEQQPDPETVVVKALQCSAGPRECVCEEERWQFISGMDDDIERLETELYGTRLQLAQVLKRQHNSEEMADKAEVEVVVAHAYKTEAQQVSTMRVRPTQRTKRRTGSRKRRSRKSPTRQTEWEARKEEFEREERLSSSSSSDSDSSIQQADECDCGWCYLVSNVDYYYSYQDWV